MILDTLLFSKNEQLQLQIIKWLSLYNFQKVPLIEIKNNFSLSYTKTSEIVQKIILSIEIDINNFEAINIKNGIVTFHTPIPTVEEYRQIISKKNITLQILLDICQGKQQKIEDYAKKFNCSSATVKRRLQPLQQFLSERTLTLSLKPLDLLGEENLIRHFYGHLFFIIYREQTLPFEQDILEYAKKEEANLFSIYTDKYPSVVKTRLKIFQIIAVTRYRQGKHPSDNFIFNAYLSEYIEEDLNRIPAQGKEKLLSLPESERIFFFYLYYFAQLKMKHSCALVDHLLTEDAANDVENPLLKQCNVLIELLKKTDFFSIISKESFETLYLSLYSYFISELYFPNGFIPMEDLSQQKNTFKKSNLATLEQKFTKILSIFFEIECIDLEKYNINTPKEVRLNRILYLMLKQFYWMLPPSEPLCIGVDINPDTSFPYFVLDDLKRMNSLEIEIYQPKHSYDILLTSNQHSAIESEDCSIFFWDLDYGNKELGLFFALISNKFAKKKVNTVLDTYSEHGSIY